jgi:hypothetical protein
VGACVGVGETTVVGVQCPVVKGDEGGLEWERVNVFSVGYLGGGSSVVPAFEAIVVVFVVVNVE